MALPALPSFLSLLLPPSPLPLPSISSGLTTWSTLRVFCRLRSLSPPFLARRMTTSAGWVLRFVAHSHFASILCFTHGLVLGSFLSPPFSSLLSPLSQPSTGACRILHAHSPLCCRALTSPAHAHNLGGLTLPAPRRLRPSVPKNQHPPFKTPAGACLLIFHGSAMPSFAPVASSPPVRSLLGFHTACPSYLSSFMRHYGQRGPFKLARLIFSSTSYLCLLFCRSAHPEPLPFHRSVNYYSCAFIRRCELGALTHLRR